MRRNWFASLALTVLFAPGVCSAEHGRWLDSKTHAGVVYFLGNAPNEIRRYDLAARTFLAPIPLSDVPTAFHVDADGIFLAYDRALQRRTLAGDGETALASTGSTVRELVTLGTNLYAATSGSDGELLRFDKQTGQAFNDPADPFGYSLSGLSTAPGLTRIFGLTVGVSPSDLVAQNLAGDGALTTQTGSPYHGAYPNGTKTYLYPDNARVIDDAGLVYNATTLVYAGSLAGQVDHVAFSGMSAYVLRVPNIVGYSADLLETGRIQTVDGVHSIAVSGTDIIGFYDNASDTLSVQIVPLATIVPPTPPAPPNPVRLEYTPDAIVLSSDNVINLLSQQHRAVFRWSIASQSYIASVPLREAPEHMTYSAASHRLYFGYGDGRITKVELASSTIETPFVNLPQGVRGLAAADPFVFAADPSGAWASHYTFRADGSMVSNVEWNYLSSQYIWNATTRRMYFFRDDTSPNDVHWEHIDANGVIAADGESPYHGDYTIRGPLRVSGDGSTVLIGTGTLFNGSNLEHLGSIANEVVDAGWASSLVTVMQSGDEFHAQLWSSGFTLVRQLRIYGSDAFIVPTSTDPYLVYVDRGIPRFTQWHVESTDADADGYADASDVFPLNAREHSDKDADGIGDNEDTDDNNDGVLDWLQNVDKPGGGGGSFGWMWLLVLGVGAAGRTMTRSGRQPTLAS